MQSSNPPGFFGAPVSPPGAPVVVEGLPANGQVPTFNSSKGIYDPGTGGGGSSVLTTKGDLLTQDPSGTDIRLAVGTALQNLLVVAGLPAWAPSPTSVLTATGDVLYASAANTLARLAAGATGKVLGIVAGIPAYIDSLQSLMTATGDIVIASGANTPARLAVGTAAQYLGGGSTPAWTNAPFVLLSDTTLGGNAASFNITGISQAYSHLKIVAKMRNDGAVAKSNWNLRFNADSGSNYDEVIGKVINATLSGESNAGTTVLQGFLAAGASATASVFGTAEVIVPDYVGSGHKTVIGDSGVIATEGTVASFHRYWNSGVWKSTAAINQVTLTPGDGSNWVAGSRLMIYGMI
jgi:hypothetical protein